MKFKADAGVGIGYGHLLGTRWRNKRSGKEYEVTETQLRAQSQMILITGRFKGGRSVWKYAPHLPFDYEEIKDANHQATR